MMNKKQQSIWNRYMRLIAKTDLGCELGDPKAAAERARLIKKLNKKLRESGYPI